MAASCPALMVAAPSSGQGKTLVTAALARAHVRAGRRVRVFKCGPDFLDPMILEAASGAPVHQLDLFMVGEGACRALLHHAAGDADLILIEGVMGLFDGAPSAADLAAMFGVPVLAVIDASAMAQTFGALVHGLATWRDDLAVAAVLANRVGSERHAEMLAESTPEGCQWLGALPRDPAIGLPERHLGLVQAEEIGDLQARLDRAADLLPIDALWLPMPVTFAASEQSPIPRLLDGRTIAVARDEAFAFLYPANIALLEAMGARLAYFSPLRASALPACDAIWLPGGYPELHAAQLAANAPMLQAIRAHHEAGKPIVAECGGMLFCAESLTDGAGISHALLGILPGQAAMQPRLAALGLQALPAAGGDLRGHTFHYAQLETPLAPQAVARSPDGRAGEPVFQMGSLWASFLHGYFPSAPHAVAAMFGGQGS
ncbi:cobyrinate a,c-diamide synthase [Novosphingobium olei]|uniref:Cobyrinate a,c-diamide synthase n=1 Tax=Novosphingobium olei TaxID=2728851 RepID=A0A7Y0BTG0_9SPHN|nr:cobyrinate a,c-diamide synthase [Novosphingobium olei]NML95596.1 cobyrinate a,c-diamide synthase [Novosphingobium olei]